MLLITAGVFNDYAQAVESVYSQSSQLPPGIKSSQVCMMNDKYMGQEQIPVQVENKTYYGCCQGCVVALQSNRSVRYALDPYSGKEVDKAKAFIVKQPDQTNQVYYFESEQNYLRFRVKQSAR